MIPGFLILGVFKFENLVLWARAEVIASAIDRFQVSGFRYQVSVNTES